MSSHAALSHQISLTSQHGGARSGPSSGRASAAAAHRNAPIPLVVASLSNGRPSWRPGDVTNGMTAGDVNGIAIYLYKYLYTHIYTYTSIYICKGLWSKLLCRVCTLLVLPIHPGSHHSPVSRWVIRRLHLHNCLLDLPDLRPTPNE